MNSVPLVLPFTLSASITAPEGSSDPSCANILADQASDIANVSCLVPYWLRSSFASPSSAHQLSSSDAPEGVALGCEDGTLYLLRQSRNRTSTPINIEQPPLSRPPSPTPVHLSSRSRSRPRTPIASLSPFSLASSRARVVSGISDEQAQAPKNYVDFDEEPEKLKELLKGGIKDSTSTDRPYLSLDRMAAVERQHIPSKGLASPSSSVRRGEAKSLLSATQSPTPSVVSLPFPTSHSAVSSPSHPPYQLSLEFHAFSPRSSPANAVVGLHALVNGRYLICLQSQGYDSLCLFFQSINRFMI
jgi:WD repeat-containing protein 7